MPYFPAFTIKYTYDHNHADPPNHKGVAINPCGTHLSTTQTKVSLT